jgi:hypothetical protein
MAKLDVVIVGAGTGGHALCSVQPLRPEGKGFSRVAVVVKFGRQVHGVDCWATPCTT